VIRALVVALAVIVVLASSSVAEHEVYYRYVVLGYVTDGTGAPASKRPVQLVRDRTGFSYLADTDARGFFVLVARLGDESVGEALTLKVGRAVTHITARFDPGDHANPRGTRVDLDGTRFVERPSSFAATLARFLETPPR
jgi:hypothetical protein